MLGATPADPTGTTVRRIGKGQGGNCIVIRQGGYYRPGMRTRAGDLARTVRAMRNKFDARFPMLRGIALEHAWSGHLCLARNNVSVMRELEPRLFAAGVRNGLGMARGTLTGIGAAELETGRTSGLTAFFTAEAERGGPVDPVREGPYDGTLWLLMLPPFWVTALAAGLIGWRVLGWGFGAVARWCFWPAGPWGRGPKPCKRWRLWRRQA